ncbi:unnamed protein product [Nesidiocoris tenuis]|uniref:Uncharacterized protein n=1 Tax=Nesidiocoris tenuis TaxID=355587 RepID=A0A6H5GYW7_9HEMI|nr:unnamed protein product [Nesidiocoris tenuis]
MRPEGRSGGRGGLPTIADDLLKSADGRPVDSLAPRQLLPFWCRVYLLSQKQSFNNRVLAWTIALLGDSVIFRGSKTYDCWRQRAREEASSASDAEATRSNLLVNDENSGLPLIWTLIRVGEVGHNNPILPPDIEDRGHQPPLFTVVSGTRSLPLPLIRISDQFLASYIHRSSPTHQALPESFHCLAPAVRSVSGWRSFGQFVRLPDLYVLPSHASRFREADLLLRVNGRSLRCSAECAPMTPAALAPIAVIIFSKIYHHAEKSVSTFKSTGWMAGPQSHDHNDHSEAPRVLCLTRLLTRTPRRLTVGNVNHSKTIYHPNSPPTSSNCSMAYSPFSAQLTRISLALDRNRWSLTPDARISKSLSRNSDYAQHFCGIGFYGVLCQGASQLMITFSDDHFTPSFPTYSTHPLDISVRTRTQFSTILRKSIPIQKPVFYGNMHQVGANHNFYDQSCHNRIRGSVFITTQCVVILWLSMIKTKRLRIARFKGRAILRPAAIVSRGRDKLSQLRYTTLKTGRRYSLQRPGGGTTVAKPGGGTVYRGRAAEQQSRSRAAVQQSRSRAAVQQSRSGTYLVI